MGKVYVVGTLDTKRVEHEYVRGLIEASGVETVLVDVGTTSGRGSGGVRRGSRRIRDRHV